MGLPPDAFYRPHTSLGSDSLHEVPAARDAHSCLPSGRARGLLIAAQGKLYLIGGVSGGRNPDDDTVIYDPAAGEWVSGPPLPVAVMDAQGVVIGSKIYVFGGYAQDQRISDRLQILDTDLHLEPAWR